MNSLKIEDTIEKKSEMIPSVPRTEHPPPVSPLVFEGNPHVINQEPSIYVSAFGNRSKTQLKLGKPPLKNKKPKTQPFSTILSQFDSTTPEYEPSETEHKSEVGTCMKMCPPTEIQQRQDDGMLAVFEMDLSTRSNSRPTAIPHLCVKRYKRSGAGEAPDYALVRPPHVCLKSTHFLLSNPFATNEDFGTQYTFIDDRLRSVNKDLRVQHCVDKHRVEITEMSIRFRILSQFILKDSESDGTCYWPNLNREQLISLFKILHHYDNDNPTSERKKSCRNGNIIDCVSIGL
eukprot:UN24128